MNKQKWLKFLNIFVVLGFLLVAGSILLLRYTNLRTSNIGHTLYEIHENAGLVLIFLIILHLTLNWGWVKAQYLKKKPSQPPAK